MAEAAYFVFQRKTAFIPLRFILPESFLIKEGSHPLISLEKNGVGDLGRIETLAKRCHYFFDIVEPNIELLIGYYKWNDRPNSIRAGIFHKDLREPYVAILNISGFEKCQREGITKRWNQPSEFINIAAINLVPQILIPTL